MTLREQLEKWQSAEGTSRQFTLEIEPARFITTRPVFFTMCRLSEFQYGRNTVTVQSVESDSERAIVTALAQWAELEAVFNKEASAEQ